MNSNPASRPTDHRNLDLWQLHLDVCFGRSRGMIIWQPRVLAWFTDKYFAGEPLPGRFRGMTQPEVYRALGCSNRLYFYNGCFEAVDPPGVRRRSGKIAADIIQSVIETPVGTLTERRREVTSSWYHPVEKWWVESPADLKVATWLAEHTEWRWNQAHYDKTLAEWDRIGAPTTYLPRVNVQHLYIDMMGVEAAIYAIHEWGSVVTDFFRVLHENHLRLIEVINRSPIQIVNFGDNLHCETLSPGLYEEYVLPAYLDRCRRLHQAGKFVHSHWDGKVKALLKFAKVSGLDGIEAITPLPQGDVTLEETKEALGDEVFLLDGIPAVYFDPTFPEEELCACAEKVIKLFAPKLVLGISDEISSHGDLERICTVGRIVDEYNAAIARGTA